MLKWQVYAIHTFPTDGLGPVMENIGPHLEYQHRMEQEGWMIFTRRLCCMFFALAIGNEVIWRTQSTDLWVKLETFAFPVVLFVFLWVQIVGLQKYLIEEPQDSSD